MNRIAAYLKKNVRRIEMSFFGVIMGAISVGIFKIAAFGVDPFQSFMAGLYKLVAIDFGLLYIIVNAVLLLFSIITDRSRIGIATFINLFLLGYITDWTYAFLQTIFVDPSMIVRIACILVGIVAICFGASFYMTADLGVSTYDAIAIVMANKWKVGKFKFIRIATDLACVILGVALFFAGGGELSGIGQVVGVGTIITALFMGPLIEFFADHIAKPFLARGTK